MKTFCAALLLMIAAAPASLAAQGSARPPKRLRLFLDCNTRCDRDYLRTSVTVVDWVTDPAASDVQVIASGLSTGAGGRRVTLDFIGHGALAGRGDTVTFSTRPDASDDDARLEFARVLRLGLVQYLLAAKQADHVAITVSDSTATAPTATTDPWNHWVFTIGSDFEFDAQSQESQYQIGGDLRANRTTDEWKVRLGLGANINRTSYTLQDSSTFVARRDRWSGSALIVRSAGPHWSIGGTSDIRSSKPDNLDLRTRLAPAVEWDLFPYREATQRQLIVVYSLGATRYDYVDTTIYNKVAETRFDQKLEVAYASQQPWGTARLSGTASAFLDDWARNRLSIYGRLEVRLARGLSFDVEAQYARVRDQITLRKGDISDQDIFLRLRELATNYQASLQLGLSYTFGSFFNSIVNPRFNELN